MSRTYREPVLTPVQLGTITKSKRYPSRTIQLAAHSRTYCDARDGSDLKIHGVSTILFSGVMEFGNHGFRLGSLWTHPNKDGVAEYYPHPDIARICDDKKDVWCKVRASDNFISEATSDRGRAACGRVLIDQVTGASVIHDEESMSCGAYNLDRCWMVLYHLYKTARNTYPSTQIFCGSWYKNNPFLQTLSLRNSTRGIFLSDDEPENCVQLKDLQYAIALWMLLPLRLLDPSEGTGLALSSLAPEDLVQVTPDIPPNNKLMWSWVQTKCPSFILSSPPFTWLANSLFREAVRIVFWEPTDHGALGWTLSATERELFIKNYLNNRSYAHPILKELRSVAPDKMVFDAVLSPHYNKAILLWRLIKPILMTHADQQLSTNSVWFNPRTPDPRIAPVINPATGERAKLWPLVSSVHEFERLVLAGGWPALGSDPYTNWSLTIPSGAMAVHAGTAIAWETALFRWAGFKPPHHGSAPDRGDWVCSKNRPEKVRPLVLSVKQIKANHEELTKDTPWAKELSTPS